MKKAIALFVSLAVSVCAFSQTINLSPLNFGDTYKLHTYYNDFVEVAEIPVITRTEKPINQYIKYVDFLSPYNFNNLSATKNWIHLDLDDVTGQYYALSKDEKGRIWVVYTILRESSLVCILDTTISKPEDAVGDYWVSWQLIEGTRDVYPILHKDAAP